MAELAAISSFLRAPGPVVDVRAPAEFAQGHIPGARNLPLFSDDERATVGTTYKQQGRAAAVQVGLEPHALAVCRWCRRRPARHR